MRRKSNVIIYEIIRDIRNLFESDEDSYYEPVRIDNAFDNDYIEYKSENDKY